MTDAAAPLEADLAQPGQADRLARATLAPQMTARGGGIVLMSSIASLCGNRDIGWNGLSKAALAELVRNLALECEAAGQCGRRLHHRTEPGGRWRYAGFRRQPSMANVSGVA